MLEEFDGSPSENSDISDLSDNNTNYISEAIKSTSGRKATSDVIETYVSDASDEDLKDLAEQRTKTFEEKGHESREDRANVTLRRRRPKVERISLHKPPRARIVTRSQARQSDNS